jgi:ElaB/YqjD/DUF883 family membrane-anchored ribosome-binding protein
MSREEYWQKNHEEATKFMEKQQAGIAELVDMLEEMLYSNSTKYREKAEALLAKYRGK